MSSDLDEFDYLRRVEMLARELVERAHDEGWLSYAGDPDDATPLQRMVNELARTLRHYHFEGDGCIDERPAYRIGGAGLIRPDSDAYTEMCSRLGVEARAEGWALWHTWDNEQQAHTLVTTCIATTEGPAGELGTGHQRPALEAGSRPGHRGRPWVDRPSRSFPRSCT